MVRVTLSDLACRASSLRHHPPAIGTGAVYSFDPVGSYEREACRAAGAAQALVQPFLDNQVCARRPRRPGPMIRFGLSDS